MVITLTARKMWCRPWGWWEPPECWGPLLPPWERSLHPGSHSEDALSGGFFRKSSASRVGLGLGAQEMHMHCVSRLRGELQLFCFLHAQMLQS